MTTRGEHNAALVKATQNVEEAWSKLRAARKEADTQESMFQTVIRAHPAWAYYNQSGRIIKNGAGEECKVSHCMPVEYTSTKISVHCHTRLTNGEWSKSVRTRIYVDALSFIPEDQPQEEKQTA